MKIVLAGVAITGISVGSTAEEKVDLVKLLNAPNRVIIDVRTESEYNGGHVAGAVLIPHDDIRKRIHAVVPSKNTPIILYCQSGRRAGIAKSTLESLGYRNVVNAGGYKRVQKIVQAPNKNVQK